MTTIYISAVPAYGRDYETPEAVLADWLAGKDFRMEDTRYRGAYINRDIPEEFGDVVVNIRYRRLAEVLPVTRSGLVPEPREVPAHRAGDGADLGCRLC